MIKNEEKEPKYICKLHESTPPLLIEILEERGWILLDEEDSGQDWNLSWKGIDDPI